MDDVFGPAALAIVTGDHDDLRQILRAAPALATQRSSVSHPTLLQFVACEAVNLPDGVGSAQILLDAGASPDEPLVAAAGCGSDDIVHLLLDRGADIDTGDTWTPLDEAAYWDQTAIIRQLVDHGAAVRALSTAAGIGSLSSLRGFFDGATLAPNAGPIGSPFPDTVPAELADDPQAIIDHAFVMAINGGQRDAAQELLDRGADINATPPGFHWRGSALHAACWRGSSDLVSWLLGCGADPSTRDGMVDSDAAGWARHHGHDHLLALLRGN